MICDVCGKTKATVHLTEIVNDQVTKLNLCENCAKKKGSEMEQHFGIADLLQGLAEFGHSPLEMTPAKTKCPNCGMTYDDFKKIGRLGCGTCYDTFRHNLSALLKRIHGSSKFVGSQLESAGEREPETKPAKKAKKEAALPKVASTPAQLAALKNELRKAVDAEYYEKAALIRDQIHSIEAKKKDS